MCSHYINNKLQFQRYFGGPFGSQKQFRLVLSQELFSLQSLVVRLQSLGVRNGAPITRLQSQQEETLEGLENVSVLF